MSAKVTAVHFQPPLEERNPELVIVKQEKALLKQVLQDKHVPLHKVLNQRPQTAGSHRASSAYHQQQRQFTMYSSKAREKHLRITHEKHRKAKIINDRIQCVNKVDTYIKLGHHQHHDQPSSHDLRRDLSPAKALLLVNSALDLQVKREHKENEEKHLRVMRGSTSEWQRHLRQYETRDRVFLPGQSRSRSPQKALHDQTQTRHHHPIMKEQQVQTIKSVFRPTHVDEQLSAMSFQ